MEVDVLTGGIGRSFDGVALVGTGADFGTRRRRRGGRIRRWRRFAVRFERIDGHDGGAGHGAGGGRGLLPDVGRPGVRAGRRRRQDGGAGCVMSLRIGRRVVVRLVMRLVLIGRRAVAGLDFDEHVSVVRVDVRQTRLDVVPLAQVLQTDADAGGGQRRRRRAGPHEEALDVVAAVGAARAVDGLLEELVYLRCRLAPRLQHCVQRRRRRRNGRTERRRRWRRRRRGRRQRRRRRQQPRKFELVQEVGVEVAILYSVNKQWRHQHVVRKPSQRRNDKNMFTAHPSLINGE